MRAIRRFALTLLSVSAVPAAQAQTGQPFSIQGSAILVVPGGSSFSDTQSGPGVELQLRRNISLWSVGGGVQYSRHDVGAENPLTLIGLFLEPRRVIPLSNDRVAPYGSVRIALFRQSLSTQGTSSSATGTQVNIGGGLLIAAGSNMNVDLGVTFGMLRFGSYSVNYAEGGGVSFPSSSGTNLVLRAGLALGFGSTR